MADLSTFRVAKWGPSGLVMLKRALQLGLGTEVLCETPKGWVVATVYRHAEEGVAWATSGGTVWQLVYTTNGWMVEHATQAAA